jgi:small-conductance mechanosensitive channel
MQNSNWQSVFFDFLVAGVIILVIFRLFRYLLPLLFARKQGKTRILRVLPLVEAPVWAIYLSWYTFRFAEIRSVYAFVVIGVLLVVIFWISRFFLRDLIAGIIFRAFGRFRQGEVIVHKKFKGNIKEFGFLSLEVETADGQSVFIPYSALAGSASIKQESADQAAAYNFSFQLDAVAPREETIGSIREFVVTLPWSSMHKMPMVTMRKGEDGPLAEVTAYPLEKSFGKKIEQHTASRFGSVKNTD